MATFADVVDDIQDTMGFTHDDALRSRDAIAYNVVLAVAKLTKQKLTKDKDKGDHRGASDSLSTFIVPIVTVDVVPDGVMDFDCKYFDLPTSVYDLTNGAGINFVRYLRNELPPNCPPALARTPFTSTTLASLNTLYNSAYQAPRTDRPYFARARANTPTGIKDRVYLFGVGAGINNLLIGLFATPNFDTFNWNDSINIPDELLMTLKQMVLQMESWALQIPQERLSQDGRDFQPGEVVRTSPIISVNNPSQQDA